MALLLGKDTLDGFYDCRVKTVGDLIRHLQDWFKDDTPLHWFEREVGDFLVSPQITSACDEEGDSCWAEIDVGVAPRPQAYPRRMNYDRPREE